MRGLPMKRAANKLAGRSYNSRGVPAWMIRPWSIKMILSARVMASTWSWVT